MRFISGDIRGSLWQDFKDRIEENEFINESYFKFDETKMEVTYLPTGNKISSKGFRKSQGSATAKLKSIAGATHVIIEECEEIEEHDFNKLRDSLRTTKSNIQIFRVWNPPQKDHWIIKKYFNIEPHPIYNEDNKELKLDSTYYIATPKEIKGHLAIFGTYNDNIENINKDTIETWESYNTSNIDHYITDILGLITSGVKGQVFKKWKIFDKLPEDAYLYRIFGIDWGGTDPNTLIRLDFDRKKKRVYIAELLYQSDIRNSEFIELIRRENPQGHEIVADSARKDKILEFQDAGLNIFGADKSKINDDFRKDVIDMIKEYKLYVHRNSTNLLNELKKYKWAVNAVTKEPLNKPEDKNNHCIDPIGYATRYYHVNYSYLYNKK
jgi:phage terminase large subunit